MKFFRVYHHKKKGYYAAPIGFNMQAALLMFLWAAANNLWGKALMLFGFVALMLGLIFYGLHAHMQVLIYTGIAGFSIVPIWSGLGANEWVFRALESQGYNLTRKIRAKDAQSAISQARKSSSSKSNRSVANKNKSRQNEEDLPINAEPEWRRRKNNRLIK